MTVSMRLTFSLFSAAATGSIIAIVVLAGHISSPVDGFTQTVGEITAEGVVSLSFQRSAQVAFVAGEVRDRTGSGTWSLPTLHCAGSWSAVREDGPALSTAALNR